MHQSPLCLKLKLKLKKYNARSYAPISLVLKIKIKIIMTTMLDVKSSSLKVRSQEYMNQMGDCTIQSLL
jgi:hypothetical protein